MHLYTLLSIVNSLRAGIIQRLGFNGHQPTIEASRRLIDSVINNGTDIPNDMRQQALSVFVFNGDSITIDKLLKVYFICLLNKI